MVLLHVCVGVPTRVASWIDRNGWLIFILGTIKVLNNKKQISFLEDLHVNSRRKTYFGAIRIECYSNFSPYVTRPSSLGLRPIIKSEELFYGRRQKRLVEVTALLIGNQSANPRS
jgi:hypothetical protein